MGSSDLVVRLVWHGPLLLYRLHGGRYASDRQKIFVCMLGVRSSELLVVPYIYIYIIYIHINIYRDIDLQFKLYLHDVSNTRVNE